jgi:hypothetical protein
MGSVGFSGCSRTPGSSGRYLAGLCVAVLGLCAAAWLALAPAAFGYRRAGEALHRAALADWATAAGLALVSLVTLTGWVVAWRRTLRAGGILARTSRRQARRAARAQRRREHDGEAGTGTADPAQVLSELRALLTPLLSPPAAGEPAPCEPAASHSLPEVPRARAGDPAAMESVLAGAELLMVGGGEEEAW